MHNYNISMAVGYWTFITIFVICITAAAMFFDSMLVLLCYILPLSIKMEVDGYEPDGD